MSAIRFVVPALLFLIVSCQQNDKKVKPIVPKKDSTTLAWEQEEKERDSRREKRLAAEQYDSVQLAIFLQKALQIAEQNTHRNQFKEAYVVTMPDSSSQVTVAMSSDFYFTKDHPHLIIRRKSSMNTYIDVYSKTGNRFTKATSHEEWNLTYVNDTIRDINGDGLKDFVVNTYGSTGCCLKAFSRVYLLRPDKKGFSEGFEFINPAFSPKEQLIRGICYGHPGETEMYKYRWNGETVDTIEYVSYQKNAKDEKTGKVIVSKDQEGTVNVRIRNSVPKEYHTIPEYDWFTGEM